MTLTFKQEKITINECPFSFNKEIEIVDFYILLGKKSCIFRNCKDFFDRQTINRIESYCFVIYIAFLLLDSLRWGGSHVDSSYNFFFL